MSWLVRFTSEAGFSTIARGSVLVRPGLVESTADHAEAAIWSSSEAATDWLASVDLVQGRPIPRIGNGGIYPQVLAWVADETTRRLDGVQFSYRCRPVPELTSDVISPPAAVLDDGDDLPLFRSRPAANGPEPERPPGPTISPPRPPALTITVHVQQCAVFNRIVSVPWTEVRFEPAPTETAVNGRWARHRSTPEAVEIRLPRDARMRDGRVYAGFDAAIGFDATSVHYLATTEQRGFSFASKVALPCVRT